MCNALKAILKEQNCHTFSYPEGHSDNTIGAGHAVQTTDEVGQVIKHRQVVFHHDDVLV